MKAKNLVRDLRAAVSRSADDVVLLSRFFKTGKGQYGEGDVFIGVRVPDIRTVCEKYRTMPLSEIESALESPIHEVRLAAVIIMAEQTKRADTAQKKALFDLYLRRTDRINNWDIVDCSCPFVVGGYLADKPRDILYHLVRSKNLWERRIAIVATWWFIRAGQLHDTFKLAEELMSDTQDLIHKATGWMLREAGKQDEHALRQFLDAHAAHMPRTALRYAIERLSVKDRAAYLALK